MHNCVVLAKTVGSEDSRGRFGIVVTGPGWRAATTKLDRNCVVLTIVKKGERGKCRRQGTGGAQGGRLHGRYLRNRKGRKGRKSRCRRELKGSAGYGGIGRVFGTGWGRGLHCQRRLRAVSRYPIPSAPETNFRLDLKSACNSFTPSPKSAFCGCQWIRYLDPAGAPSTVGARFIFSFYRSGDWIRAGMRLI